MSDWISISEDGDIITLYDVRYARDVFRYLGLGPIGSRFSIVKREDGIITLQILDEILQTHREPC